MRLSQLVQSPLLHFAIVGSLLFEVVGWGSSRSTDNLLPEREPLTVTAQQVERAVKSFAGRHGSPPNELQRRALIAKLAEEEMLYREALYLGLDRGDPSVSWRLLHKYRLVAERPDQPAERLLAEARELGLHENDVVVRRILAQRMRQLLQRDPAAIVTHADIDALVARSGQQFMNPPTVSFSHVYLGDGETSRGQLAATRSSLDTGSLTAEQMEATSLPFPLGLDLKAQTRSRLVGRFGQNFADEMFTLPPGGWHGPVESVYGKHLVRVTDRRGETRKPSEELKKRALYDISRERSTRRVEASLDWLRTLYRLRIEGEETEFMTGSGKQQETKS